MSETLDIDLLAYIRRLVQRRNTILSITVVTMILAGVITLFIPKYYLAKGTFLLPVNDASPGLSSYSSFLGKKGGGSPESYIQNILNSKRLKFSIAESLYPYFRDETDFLSGQSVGETPTEKQIRVIAGKLRLGKNFSFGINKEGLFKLRFLARSPEIAETVLAEIFTQVNKFNEDLEIFPKRKIIIVLDKPEAFKGHFQPNLIFNLIIGLATGFFFSTSMIIVGHHMSGIKRYISAITQAESK